MFKIFTRLLIISFLLSIGQVMASDEVVNKLKSKLAKLIPGEEPTSVKESPAKGLYEVIYGTQVFYIHENGKYLLQGELIDVDTRTNLTADAQSAGRKKAMAAVSDDKTIIFAPKEKAKHTVTVFTDIDCPYCRKMHNEMKGYNEEGIAIRYMLYPRAGVDSPSYDKAVNVWCAENQKEAMTKSKNGKEVKSKTCENPIKEHMAIANEIGVNGTPAIVLDDGHLIPGYRPPKDLAKVLEQLSAK
jgi:thiol:disulfide interchange protein DsbC